MAIQGLYSVLVGRVFGWKAPKRLDVAATNAAAQWGAKRCRESAEHDNGTTLVKYDVLCAFRSTPVAVATAGSEV